MPPNRPTTHDIDSVIDSTERRFNGTPMDPQQPAEHIQHLCRNCGRAIQNVLQEYCGEPDCDERAAVRRIF